MGGGRLTSELERGERNSLAAQQPHPEQHLWGQQVALGPPSPCSSSEVSLGGNKVAARAHSSKTASFLGSQRGLAPLSDSVPWVGGSEGPCSSAPSQALLETAPAQSSSRAGRLLHR